MFNHKSILAIIPARGGSKGLPRKNVRLLLGKPLIAWTIEQALRSRYLDKVVVSTEDKNIAGIARKYGAEIPFLRPKSLATDKAKTIDVIFHALDYFKSNSSEFNYLALLEPTSPLRKKNDIDKAIAMLIKQEKKADSLVSVGEIALEHPCIAKKINANGYVRPYADNALKITRRQDLPKAYFPYGVIYLSKTATLRARQTFYQKTTLPYFIERWQNYEVDSFLDLLCVEAIAGFMRKEL